MQWAHVASRDLVQWVQLPPALLPNQWLDQHGAWDGSISLDAFGTPRLIFSCLPANGTNMLCTATPRNVSDPWLVEWEVAPQPVVRSRKYTSDPVDG